MPLSPSTPGLVLTDRPLPAPILLTGWQRADGPQFIAVPEGIRVPRMEGGRPRTRPDRVLADRAYTSRGNRAYLRRRGIKATIPAKSDQGARRRKRGSKGGRPPVCDLEIYSDAMRSSAGSTGSNAAMVWRPGSTISPCVTKVS